MYKISVKVFGTPKYFKEIAKANPTVDPKRIKPGMKLNLPDINKLKAAEATRAKSNVTSRSRSSSSNATTGSKVKVHTIKAGETLSSISNKYFGTPNRWREIFNANKKALNDDPDAIQPGMKLVVPNK
ncbi:LysM domain/BON superfamily protein [Poriferisphaera corsica]|uniref:LysM domain/BON superfamily protein n=1 Tax=Poriferisphaera corsica TaxID=2528020 RepID=A0A517YSX1_9BACT|nr:LysM peptidoglycan-binding domain-containing protein [Poriferisphaera corsica]QDU33311.1 LysM domain/BON superfamily protein [Poriferisphaera corsica]